MVHHDKLDYVRKVGLVKVTVRACRSKHDCYYCVMGNADLFAVRLSLMVCHHELEYLVVKLLKVKFTAKLQNVSECLSH